jgi:phage terminase large subunit GpA-like protein
MGPASPYETVLMMWAAQSGKSSMLENFLGYVIELDPGPVLLVEPREVDAAAFSKDRLAPMLRDTPCLRGKVADARSRDSKNTILHKKSLGGSITLAAANSPAGLAMRSIRFCLLDEVDRHPASAGSEGDPVNLAACAIDAGYESQAVYEFCRTRYHRRIFAVKGKGGPLPVWQRKPTAKNIRGEKPWIAGTGTAKETIYGRLKNPALGTPGYSHFPADREEGYCEQLLGEVLVTTYAKGQPKREWRPKPGVRQEALDARVYAYAALRALISMGLSLDNEADRILAANRPRPVPEDDTDRAKWLGERGRKWLYR